MITQTVAATNAWKATERTPDAIVNVNGTDYHTSDITSIAYDSGAFTGDTFGIGSNYENNITVIFAHLVEGLKQGQVVTAKIGVKLPDGTFEYSSLGVFVISDDIEMDRNNDVTTIKCYDRFALMEGTYVSKLTYPAKVVDVIAEIANLSGVPLNTDDIARLPVLPNLPRAISGQTYRNAIGWIAQFFAGYALFDRDGKLTIRSVTDADYQLDPSQYEQGGLTKNEAAYSIGGIQCQVTTTTTDSTGDSTDNTVTLQVGSTAGSQIQLTNNLMTQDQLNAIWDQIKDLNFYPFTLNWFGNPAIEAGDWLTLVDTKGNSFNVPNNSYQMTFDGSLSAVASAGQTPTGTDYAYQGDLQQKVDSLFGMRSPTGNFIYGPDTTTEPTNAKFGDIWWKQNGNVAELWIYQAQADGTGKWTLEVNQLFDQQITNQAESTLSDAKSYADNINTSLAPQIAAASSQADSAFDKANSAFATASEASSAVATKVSNSDFATYQTQQADLIASKVSSADYQTMVAQLPNQFAVKATETVASSAASQATAAKNSAASAVSSAASAQSSAANALSQANTAYNQASAANSLAGGANSSAASAMSSAAAAQSSAAAAQSSAASAMSQASQASNAVSSLATATSAQLSVQNTAIQAKVSQTDFNNLKVGGRNYLLGTNSNTGNVPHLNGQNGLLNHLVASKGTNTTRFTADTSTTETFVQFIGGYSPSQGLYGLQAGQTYTLNAKFNFSGSNNIAQARILFSTTGTNWDIDNRYNILSNAVTFTIPTNAKAIIVRFNLCNSTGGNPAVGDWMEPYNEKLELGTKPTDWSPAPEDLATEAEITVMKDDINLRVQKGDLITQLNLEAGTTLLQTGKFIINADTTVISGTSWLDGAVIKDASIGTAKIGTIDASVAHIINIDANNITANAASFFTTQWQNNYGNRIAINANNIKLLSATGSNLTIGANSLHFSNTSGSYYSVNDFGSWIDSNGNATTATGLYTGVRGGNNSFWSLLNPGGATILLYAGSSMNDGANNNVLNNFLNSYVSMNLWGGLHFYGYENNDPTYISVDSVKRTMNFYTGNAKNGNGNWFYFNHKVIVNGGVSSSSLLSLKNIIGSMGTTEAIDEILKTDIRKYTFKDDTTNEMQLSPIIDDVNATKQYYIPDIINDGDHVNIYAMASMAWLAIQQFAAELGDATIKGTALLDGKNIKASSLSIGSIDSNYIFLDSSSLNLANSTSGAKLTLESNKITMATPTGANLALTSTDVMLTSSVVANYGHALVDISANGGLTTTMFDTNNSATYSSNLGTLGLEVMSNSGSSTGFVAAYGADNLQFIDGSLNSFTMRFVDAPSRRLVVGFGDATSGNGFIDIQSDVQIDSNGTSGTSYAMNFPNSSETNQATTHSNNRIYSTGNYLQIQGSGGNPLQVGTDGTQGGRIWSMSFYNRTYSSGVSNLVVTTSGTVGRLTSARKYKLDDQDATDVIADAHKVLSINPKTWFDKGEIERINAEMSGTGKARDEDLIEQHYGFIADDFDAAGLKQVVIYDDQGQVDSLMYDRITMYHNVVLQEHDKEINQLQSRITELETEIKTLKAA